jgi:hypothetical protein
LEEPRELPPQRRLFFGLVVVPNLGYRGCTGVSGGCSGETGETLLGLVELFVV